MWPLTVSHDNNDDAVWSQVCMAAFEMDMERAFAVQQSQDKQCKICLDVVYEKASPSERRFGILSSCCHTYCLSCIRQWRCVEQFQNQIRKWVSPCGQISALLSQTLVWCEVMPGDCAQVLSRVPCGVGVCHSQHVLGGRPRWEESPHWGVQIWSQVRLKWVYFVAR